MIIRERPSIALESRKGNVVVVKQRPLKLAHQRPSAITFRGKFVDPKFAQS